MDRLWDWLKQNGYLVDNPRPAVGEILGRVLEEELKEELAQGEMAPEPVSVFPDTVRLVGKNGAKGLLYTVESLSEEGLWGVGVEEVSKLQRQPLPWALVLLELNRMSGYLLTSDRVKKAVPRWPRIAPGGPHYELRASDELAQNPVFQSPNDLARLFDQLLKPR